MANLSVSRATLFRRLKRFCAEGRASALAAGKTGRRLGVDPLDPELKSIVDRRGDLQRRGTDNGAGHSQSPYRLAGARSGSLDP
jgi:hypothetical protein